MHIAVVPGALIAIYLLALQFKMINEHFDSKPPRQLEGHLVAKSMRYNPFPISVIEVDAVAGKRVSVDVLDEMADQLNLGQSVSIVEKPGFLGKVWYQDSAFHASLENSRLFQGVIAVGIFAAIVALWIRMALKGKNRLLGSFSLAAALALGFLLFHLIP